ncbi:cupredoxin domain-containing protein [Methylovirgula sp. 4M-Z18]|uniref:cupredoxin domain-containing protein n=1 Tax=Methylovirgula sp. 4M-Z18 TaxID=2293567 RepID=UPI000E2EDAA0|nr:cupredoxin family copper-binding protein [Methylovirgula sp. 4M-Z18]RFB81625.1 amicyanin [Methylovirgula sp. 4M-Z18]
MWKRLGIGRACACRIERSRRLFLVLGATQLLAATLLLAAARADDGASVTIDNFTFSPQTLTVAAGTTVVWKNNDDIPHLVVANDKSFRSKALDTDDSYSFTFTTPGTYNYFCGLHPHMTGTVVVK